MRMAFNYIYSSLVVLVTISFLNKIVAPPVYDYKITFYLIFNSFIMFVACGFTLMIMACNIVSSLFIEHRRENAAIQPHQKQDFGINKSFAGQKKFPHLLPLHHNNTRIRLEEENSTLQSRKISISKQTQTVSCNDTTHTRKSTCLWQSSSKFNKTSQLMYVRNVRETNIYAQRYRVGLCRGRKRDHRVASGGLIRGRCYTGRSRRHGRRHFD